MISKNIQKIYIETDCGKDLCAFEPDEKKDLQ